MIYLRTCQECGHKQQARDPASYKGETWRDVKCRKCKSSALDYGSLQSPEIDMSDDLKPAWLQPGAEIAPVAPVSTETETLPYKQSDGWREPMSAEVLEHIANEARYDPETGEILSHNFQKGNDGPEEARADLLNPELSAVISSMHRVLIASKRFAMAPPNTSDEADAAIELAVSIVGILDGFKS